MNSNLNVCYLMALSLEAVLWNDTIKTSTTVLDVCIVSLVPSFAVCVCSFVHHLVVTAGLSVFLSVFLSVVCLRLAGWFVCLLGGLIACTIVRPSVRLSVRRTVHP